MEGFPLRVSVDGKKNQNITLLVLDQNGLLIRHLYQGLWPAEVNYLEWDGKDDSSNTVSPGRYTIVFKTGRKSMSQIVTIQPSQP